MTNPALHLFGAIHVDRPSKVRAELDEYAADLDAIFLERPVEDLTPTTYLRGLVFAPGVVLAALFYGLLLLPFHALVLRDGTTPEWVATEHVAEERDLPVHHVDDHPIRIVATEGWRLRAIGWIALLVPLALFPVETATTAGVLVGLFAASSAIYRIDRRLWVVAGVPLWIAGAVAAWFGLVSGYVMLTFVLAFAATTIGTLDRRNRIMLDRAREISEEEGYEESVLVTGKAHLGGMVNVADEVGVDVARVHVSKVFRRSDRTYEGIDEGIGTFGVDPKMDTAGDVWTDRAIAAVIDLAIGVVVASPLIVVVEYLVFSTLFGGGSVIVVIAALFWGILGGPVLYHSRFERRGGQTIGKRRMGLVVVRTDGSSASRFRVMARNLLRPLDIATGYLVGGVVAGLTDQGQKPSDLLADTVVVETK